MRTQRDTHTIWLLVDYREHFYSSVRSRGASMDIVALRSHFADEGWRLEVMSFKDVDLGSTEWCGRYVLYQSAEDRGLLYKDYIEDVLLALVCRGAVLIPGFFEFRAHHNKSFMELFREVSPCGEVKTLRSHIFGTYEDFSAYRSNISLPVVVKPASGALSAGVCLARTESELDRAARKLSRSLHPVDWLKDVVNRVIRPGYVPKSSHRRKFVVQEFVNGLRGDYKVLIYGDRYFVLYRQVRANDFRASGSGIFSYQRTLPEGLLPFARAVYENFQVPYISIDVASNDKDLFLIEYQFISFGSYTLEHAPFWFELDQGEWVVRDGKSVLEKEVARSVVRYLSNQKSRQTGVAGTLEYSH